MLCDVIDWMFVWLFVDGWCCFVLLSYCYVEMFDSVWVLVVCVYNLNGCVVGLSFDEVML